VINLDEETVEILRTWKSQRGGLALDLVRPKAHVDGRANGSNIDPNALLKRFQRHVASANQTLSQSLPAMPLHGTRHTHATALLAAGVPVKVVSERLGHSDVTITLQTYQHVLPGMQAEAAATFASLIMSAEA
jgi:integrase